MLNREVVMETSLRQEECQARLTSNIKPTPGYATWWTGARDKTLWGSVSPEDFRVQLGRGRQLTSTEGRFVGVPSGTRIVMAVGFKVWVVVYSILSAVALVAIGVLIAETFGDN